MANSTFISNLSRPRLIQKFYPFSAIRVSNTVPFILVPDPQPNQLLIPIDGILEFKAGIAYAAPITFTFDYSDNGGKAAQAFDTVSAADSIQWADLGNVAATSTVQELISVVGKGFVLTADADRADGTGTLIFTLVYRVKKLFG